MTKMSLLKLVLALLRSSMIMATWLLSLVSLNAVAFEKSFQMPAKCLNVNLNYNVT